jgi:hypothetical protein
MVLPYGVLELMLYVEQPDTDRCGDRPNKGNYKALAAGHRAMRATDLQGVGIFHCEQQVDGYPNLKLAERH